MEPNNETPMNDDMETVVHTIEEEVDEQKGKNKKMIFLAVLALLFIIAGMFSVVYLKQQQLKEGNEAPVNDEHHWYDDVARIDAKHFYIDGVHTVVGSIDAPTPCDLVEGSAIVAESYPEQITLDFKVINNAETCVQVVTEQRFMISATASEEATFNAMIENRYVELNLIEAAPGETPEDFELYIKG